MILAPWSRMVGIGLSFLTLIALATLFIHEDYRSITAQLARS